MAKAELGTKRLCASCGAKFYDLNKDPITCPKCSAVFQVAVPTSRARPDAAAAARTVVATTQVEAPETADAEFVSLEEADAEAQGKKVAGDPAADTDDDIEIEEGLDDDAAFIPEEEEEDNDDVTDIIGEVDKEEET